MEVSSHSIDQGRINGIAFEAGIFTNLTQDHLDYHGTMLAYAAVKKRFLEEFPIKHLIINADDAYGREWLQELPHASMFAYGLKRAALDRYDSRSVCRRNQIVSDRNSCANNYTVGSGRIISAAHWAI